MEKITRAEQSRINGRKGGRPTNRQIFIRVLTPEYSIGEIEDLWSNFYYRNCDYAADLVRGLMQRHPARWKSQGKPGLIPRKTRTKPKLNPD